ncbi:hypothetical protein [Cryptosporangium sp. NPDC051539]|uniref:hypothetical protein n=1 Tax=Cryptosporangium sp. NPDC051539 TaxID=3363962 RepID=UPI0037B5FF77
MPSREGQPWSLDEYLIVGELWKRRGRAVGRSDSEVLELADLLGRSPGSISYRVGNFAGTDHPGRGLKPLTGTPLREWEKVRDDPAALLAAVRDARARLASARGGQPANELRSERDLRIVPPEKPSTEAIFYLSEERATEATQTEAILREKFRSWRDPNGDRLEGIEIPVGGSTLRVDLYDQASSLLIEVKAKPDRFHLRLAVGQLFDYRRYLKRSDIDANLAVLVPEPPSADLMDLLNSANIGAIWPTADSFSDSEGGLLLNPTTDTTWVGTAAAIQLEAEGE